MRHSCSGGFTLIEVLVALMLSGIVAIGVRNILGGIADSATRVSENGAALDERANRERLLRALVADVESDGDPQTTFAGTSSEAIFTSWCPTAQGWSERCRLSLSLEHDTVGVALVVRPSTGEALELRQVARDATLQYLTDLNSGGQWADHWAAGALIPRAIGIMSSDDTLILRIGDRG